MLTFERSDQVGERAAKPASSLRSLLSRRKKKKPQTPRITGIYKALEKLLKTPITNGEFTMVLDAGLPADHPNRTTESAPEPEVVVDTPRKRLRKKSEKGDDKKPDRRRRLSKLGELENSSEVPAEEKKTETATEQPNSMDKKAEEVADKTMENVYINGKSSEPKGTANEANGKDDSDEVLLMAEEDEK